MKPVSVTFFLLSILLFSCYRMRPSQGGGQTGAAFERKLNTTDIALPPGYKIEAVASGFTFPSAIAFDEEGKLYITETGYSYGEVWGEPKLIRLDGNGKTTVIATGTRNGPWTGVTFHQGSFYVAEGGEMEGGKILKISKTGEVETLVSNLPSVGDHHTNGPVIKDGYIYFGQGTATNSGVVGPDNMEFGWLKRKPSFHDIPCGDIVLNGVNIESDNVLTDDPNDKTKTGAYSPFGTATTAGQVIKGAVPCTGSILRIPLAGGKPELVAWGFRNPFGLAVSPENKLYITENGYDDRGSRPAWGTGDVLWQIEAGKWYGWPDFSAGQPLTDKDEYRPPTKPRLQAILQTLPNQPPKPAAILGVHASANGLDFCRNNAFGFVGEAFVAEFGDMAPKVGKVLAPVGFKVVRVNVNNGAIMDFAVNKGKKNGPATWLEKGGLERPLSVKFDRAGTALYIVDFGIMQMTQQGPLPKMKTGVIWKITKEGT